MDASLGVWTLPVAETISLGIRLGVCYLACDTVKFTGMHVKLVWGGGGGGGGPLCCFAPVL